MTHDSLDHDRANGPGPHGGNGTLGNWTRDTGIDWTTVVAAVLAVIVLGIAFVLLT